jgi:alpha-tubulin suppressor-like RCC1 family protein
LKDTIILSVSCGHTHSMAITITRRVLAWGSNKSFQLGLGPKAPNVIYIPTVIPDFYDVAQISCGSEHTVAVTTNDQVYSWGEGEGGLLGHGDTKTQKSPKMVESLKKLQIQSIVCGGLHTIVLSRQGQLYTWGRAEGGQLGLPYDQLVHDTEKGELYLPTPKRIKGIIEGVFITQVACGDAHSLALSQNGQVYGWGYTSSGQLGLGISGENSDPSMRCIKEPVLIEKLANIKITDIYAGYTFSIFINDKKEPYACGLNDYSQLGIEKTVMNVTESKMSKQSFSNKYNEVVYPTKIDCFHKIPFLKLACGENHSVGVSNITLLIK